MKPFPLSIILPFVCFLFSFTTSSDNPTHFTGDVSINCGSISNSAVINGREWKGDIKPKSSSFVQIDGSSTISTVTSKLISAVDPVPHKTARISRSQFSYSFKVSPGEKILRFHFNPSPYKGFRRLKDLFTVEAGPFTLLSNFSASLTAAALGANPFAKEFCITIEENKKLNITFSPETTQSLDTTYAFINGIEIISVPKHLSYFRGGEIGAQVIGQKSPVCIDYGTALELVHRLNVKRDFVSSSDDFDDVLGVWGTATKPNKNEINNLTWKISVDVGFRYLVRIHFRNLGHKVAEGDGLIFKVLINGKIVDTNTDIFKERDEENGMLWYRDYKVAMKGRKQEAKQDLLITLLLYDEVIDEVRLIKGVEVFKLSNPDNSLASPNALPPARDSQSWIIQNLLSFLGGRNAIATFFVALISLINTIVYELRKNWETSNTEEENRPSVKAQQHCRHFSLAEIQLATRNFNDGLLIGRGGFGKVYKGLIDKGQTTVAVKRLKPNSKQGKHEFLTEIETLSELRHINLVSLIGYCSERREMILVYEYMACGTLADHLYKFSRYENNSSSLTWKQLLNICIGAGRGLDYLHTGHRVIHRDVKASNILLDENFIAKVSDFGLAKPEDRSKLQSHVSTNVKGTFGYFDPYYLSTRKLTKKSDTYAFGVVLLEVLCGRPAMDPGLGEDECFLTKWARNRMNKGEVDQIVASSLKGEISPDSLKVFGEVVKRCLHDEPKKRPTMTHVVARLEFALELHERREESVQNQITSDVGDFSKLNEESTSSISTEQQNNRKMDNAGKKDWRKLKTYKSLGLWTWDAFCKRVKLLKKRELRLGAEICEDDIKLSKFDLAIIEAATNHFSASQKIGEGGFGSVYKAVLPTGSIVAVTIYSSSRLSLNEFKREIFLVSNLHHPNIIKLLGYCIHEGGILLHEFMENGSLDTFIFDGVRHHQIQWPVRFKIILGVARGVLYLHQGSEFRIIHRDLNPVNILLDNEMNPKINGFGSSKSFEEDQSEVESRVVGILRYVSPEYAMEGRVSEKSDVYSFGVTVLEILSGTKNVGYPRFDLNLIDCAWELWNEGKTLDLVDESIRVVITFSEEEALRCIQVGLLCTQFEPHHRPTMYSALQMLLGEDLSLQDKTTEAASRRPNIECVDATNLDDETKFLYSRRFRDNKWSGISDSVIYSEATFQYDNALQR